MERRIYDAAREGSVDSLLKLLKEDPIILERVTNLGTYSETPLHVAVILGNLDFAKELLNRKPSLATEVDLHKSTPLHLASATNNLEIIRLLLDVNRDMCLAWDVYGRRPVHVAAIRGRVDALKELVRADVTAAQVKTDQGDTVLHLCLKYNQFDALKVLVEEIRDPEFVNSVDRDDNTVLHLAVLAKQSEAVSFLLQNTSIDVNAKNAKNQTAMDILYMDLKGNPIGCALHNAGAVTSTYASTNLPLLSPNTITPKRQNSVKKYLEDKQEAVMVAASLIAAAAFQVGVTPPGGVYQDTVNDKNTTVLTKHKAGTSIMAYSNYRLYSAFIVENTVGFVASLSVFLLLLTGLPQKHKFFQGFFMVAIWISIVAITASYSSSIITVAPPFQQLDSSVEAFSYTVLVIAIILWVIIILWYLGLGPRLQAMFYNRSSSKNGAPTRSPSLLGGANGPTGGGRGGGVQTV